MAAVSAPPTEAMTIARRSPIRAIIAPAGREAHSWPTPRSPATSAACPTVAPSWRAKSGTIGMAAP